MMTKKATIIFMRYENDMRPIRSRNNFMYLLQLNCRPLQINQNIDMITNQASTYRSPKKLVNQILQIKIKLVRLLMLTDNRES